MNEVNKVYSPREIQKMLGLGKESVYGFLEEVYMNKKPFIVIKIGITGTLLLVAILYAPFFNGFGFS